MSHARRRLWSTAVLAAALVGIAAFTSGNVRGYLGDVLIVTFLVGGPACLELGTARARLVGIGVVALVLWLLQGLDLVGPDAPLILHLTLGSTLDPWDLVAYALGLGLAAALEHTLWAAPEPRAPDL